MKYNFPETIFVKHNSCKDQFNHICSELLEAQRAFNAKAYDDGNEELMDLYHSIETYFRIMENGREHGYINKLHEKVEKKNRDRGYYL